jgi:tRNA 2-thiocytidine biosynthesis protein TtcA
MPPKLKSDNNEHVIIRPLAYAKEKEIEQFSQMKGFPIIPCNLCGSQENLERQNIKKMLNDWDQQFPGRIESMFCALKNVFPSHFADTELFDFKTLSQDVEEGDVAFDTPEIAKFVDADVAAEVETNQTTVNVIELV